MDRGSHGMPRPLHPAIRVPVLNMDSSTSIGSVSQSTQSHSDPGDITSTTLEGDKSVLESTESDPVANLAQIVKREERENVVISQDDEGSQGEADMDICEESEDAEEIETKDGMVKGEEKGGMESGLTTSEIPVPSKLQRFYFESDTLALKNNPE